MKLKCPNCNGTRFNVTVFAFQEYDGQHDEWGEVQVTDVDNRTPPYLCLNCSKESFIEDLRRFE